MQRNEGANRERKNALSGVFREALVGWLTPLALATEELRVEELLDVLLRVIVLLLAVGELLFGLGERLAKFSGIW